MVMDSQCLKIYHEMKKLSSNVLCYPSFTNLSLEQSYWYSIQL